jgi:hypothetical protein
MHKSMAGQTGLASSQFSTMNGMSRTAAALSPQTRTLVVSTSMAATNRVGQQLKRAC